MAGMLEKKVESHYVVNQLKDITKPNQLKLVGGAIIDIMDGNAPKDYDMMVVGNLPIEQVIAALEEKGCEYMMESKFAVTLKAPIKDERGKRQLVSIQIIKRTSVEEFPFKVQRSNINLKTGKVTIDRDYHSRLLTPINYTKEKAIEQLLVTPKYINKGFEIKRSVWEGVVAQAASSSGVLTAKSDS